MILIWLVDQTINSSARSVRYLDYLLLCCVDFENKISIYLSTLCITKRLVWADNILCRPERLVDSDVGAWKKNVSLGECP